MATNENFKDISTFIATSVPTEYAIEEFLNC